MLHNTYDLRCKRLLSTFGSSEERQKTLSCLLISFCMIPSPISEMQKQANCFYSHRFCSAAEYAVAIIRPQTQQLKDLMSLQSYEYI